jgi:hypothetical protein
MRVAHVSVVSRLEASSAADNISETTNKGRFFACRKSRPRYSPIIPNMKSWKLLSNTTVVMTLAQP